MSVLYFENKRNGNEIVKKTLVGKESESLPAAVHIAI